MFSHSNLIEEVSALPPSGPSTPTFKDSSFRKTLDLDDSDFKTPSQIRQIQTPDTASTPDDHTFAIPQPIFDSLKFKAPSSNEDGLELSKISIFHVNRALIGPRWRNQTILPRGIKAQ